jgi:hypothetical protein
MVSPEEMGRWENLWLEIRLNPELRSFICERLAEVLEEESRALLRQLEDN